MRIVHIKYEGAIVKLMVILLTTLVFLFSAALTALGNPQPQSLGANVGGDRVISISGKDFGSAPELVDTYRMVESAVGLKSCVLLAEHQVLAQCKNLTVLPVIEWSEDSILTEMRMPLPRDPELMYLFVFDDEGGASYPIGPLNIEESIPVSNSQLNVKEVVIEKIGSVITLELSKPETEGPGQPGQPTLN